jgi:hypothetical protein
VHFSTERMYLLLLFDDDPEHGAKHVAVANEKCLKFILDWLCVNICCFGDLNQQMFTS